MTDIVKKLHAALRRVSIVTEDEIGSIHTLTCNCCARLLPGGLGCYKRFIWNAGEPEQHADDCLARPVLEEIL